MTLLSVDRLSLTLRGRAILRDVSFGIGTGEVVGLIGPNGAGKTMLMRAALGLVGCEGHSSLAELPQADRAKAVAWLPQAREIAWPVDVESLVTLGRLPWRGTGRTRPETDRRAVDAAIRRLDLEAFRGRTATRLSGGEQARVLIARAIAQEAPLLMADEPSAALDPAHQIAMMDTFRGLAGEGKSVLVSLHDIGLAARHCTRVLMLGESRLVADGAPGEVLTDDRLAQVFGIRAYHVDTPDGPIFQPLESIRRRDSPKDPREER